MDNTENLTQYTVMPIPNPQHRQKLHQFVQSRGKVRNKASLCRFYLRGICIMKAEYCKFAHSVQELQLDEDEAAFYWKLSDKERKKRQFTEKKEFNQTALFILKNVQYCVLHQYQSSDRYAKSGLPFYDLETISSDRPARIRIREIMHRENWDGFLDFLERRFPRTNYPISFVSHWYANFGFDKPQTRCKFGDFLKYSMFVRKYMQVDIVFPPNISPSIYLVNSQSKHTILQTNITQIYEKCMQDKEKECSDKMEVFLGKALPQLFAKRYICRYFMAGNCQDTAEDCLYCHSVPELQDKYELDQEFPVEHRQPVMPIQVRMNFQSLFLATRQYPEYQVYSQQDINLNTTIRNELRTRVHRKLFADFMEMLEGMLSPESKCSQADQQETVDNHIEQKEQQKQQQNTQKQNKKQQKEEENQPRVFSVALTDLQRYYQGAGFNHTNQNKFQHLESALWDLGFYMEDVVVKDQIMDRKKKTFAYKIPPLQYLNTKYWQIIRECVNQQLVKIGEGGMLLQSALKRVVYSYPKHHILPLHVYLRSRNLTFQQVVRECCQEEQASRIFFETGEENVKKLTEIVRKYMKKNKSYLTKIDDIESHIRIDKKQQVNTNHFINLRTQLQTTVVQLGKRVYYWPFDNNAYMLDPTHFPSHKKALQSNKLPQDESLSNFHQRCKLNMHTFAKLVEVYGKSRVVVVDCSAALCYAKAYLEGCARFGVDLEGRLKIGGYVDLVQVSAVKTNQRKIQHKQIFVFDVFLMKKNMELLVQSAEEVYKGAIGVLKQIFECPTKLKILHDCRQDSIALRHILKINPVNIFDTSGFDIYLNQKKTYNQKYGSNYELLRRLYDIKVPGLNTILDTYKAPNGVNIFKDSMKKKFGENNREYFQQRPIDDEFLQYSVRDVEDLIEVWEVMIGDDDEGIAGFVGKLYSS